jgi:hypothetical protein
VESDGDGGLVVRALGLWLDPPGARPFAFVSHAHASSALESGRAMASPETLLLASSDDSDVGRTPRPGDRPQHDATPIEWDGAVELPVAREYGGGTARLTIAPAGHLLGAAQLVVDHPRGRFVYTGDWSAFADDTHPAGASVACDELAVTTTFALPIFRFDPVATVLESLVAWCRDALASGVTPVVLAQTPGPAQSILLALARNEVPAVADPDVRRASRAYARCGVPVGEAAAFASTPADPGQGTGRNATSGAVVVASTRTRRSELRPKGRSVVAYASGWSVLDAIVDQRRADAAFALADHADSDALLALVQGTGARVVHAAYGDARALAELLHGRGLAVHPYETSSVDERSGS